MFSVACVMVAAVAACGGRQTAARSSGSQSAPADTFADIAPDDKEDLRTAAAATDRGDTLVAIEIIDRLLKKYPAHPGLLYEKALALYRAGKPAKARAIVAPLLDRDHVDPMCFVLVGNSYDDEGDLVRAQAVYRRGIERYPDTGMLYVNLGIALMRANDMAAAQQAFLQAMKKEPSLPSSYYWAARLFARSNARLWALMYGELFANVHPNGPRKAEMSRLLYAIYDDDIKVSQTDEGADVSLDLGPNILLKQDIGASGEVKTCFSIDFQMVTVLALSAPEVAKGWLDEPLTVDAIHKLRSSVGTTWTEKNADCPNLLLQRYAELAKANLTEAYDQWLFREARPDDWSAWLAKHQDQAHALVEWFNTHPLKPTAGDHFGIDHY